MATARLRLLLRVWAVVFALGAIDFLVFPYVTVRVLNTGARALGMHEVVALNAGQDFWLTLAAPYMVLVAAFSWVAQRGVKIAAQPVQFLMLAKASSSLTSLVLFVSGGFPYAFLANFAVDGAILLITFWFYRAARLELVHPA
ncbi:hypothetical protein EPN29_00240 [bacterium]|nr:MAG: hypothetical protein EPN29_00240 [bacterium]